MNKLKAKDFARALGISDGIIKVNHSRGKLFRNENDKTFDIEHPMNKIWISEQVRRGKTFDLNRILDPIDAPVTTQKITPKKTEPVNDEVKRISGELSIRKAEAEVLIKERQAEKSRIEIEKMQGILVPTDAVRTVFIFSVEAMRSTFIQELNSLANIFSQKTDLNQDQLIELRKDLADDVRRIMEDVRTNLISGIDGVVKEWQVTNNNENNE